MGKLGKHRRALLRRPEEIVYRNCFVPVDLRALLATAETRAQIRRLPPAQLAFAVKELEGEELAQLLPNITEEQWAAVLDLSLWGKDRLNVSGFLGWHRHLPMVDDAVARKILRAVDREAWLLTFLRSLEIYPKVDAETFAGEPRHLAGMPTPDGNFLIGLPRDPEKALVVRALLERWYALDAEAAAQLLLESLYRSPSELEEEAYSNRTRRMEELGFLDYFEAVNIYSPLALLEPLPVKGGPPASSEPGELPAAIRPVSPDAPMLLFQAMSRLDDASAVEALVQELYSVCNRVVIADQAAAGSAQRVRRKIRKAVGGINLGLSLWSGDDVAKAANGVVRHYLVSFFQLGYGALVRLRERARDFAAVAPPEPGSFFELALEGLLGRFPRRQEKTSKGLRSSYFETAAELKAAYQMIEEAERARDSSQSG